MAKEGIDHQCKVEVNSALSINQAVSLIGLIQWFSTSVMFHKSPQRLADRHVRRRRDSTSSSQPLSQPSTSQQQSEASNTHANVARPPEVIIHPMVWKSAWKTHWDILQAHHNHQNQPEVNPFIAYPPRNTQPEPHVQEPRWDHRVNSNKVGSGSRPRVRHWEHYCWGSGVG